jgi:hypothetical protein
MQEIINDPQYYPFLRTDASPYYTGSLLPKNENIEEWAEYLNIPYEDAEYLVFKVAKATVQQFSKGNVSANSDPKLRFVTADWAKKYKQALLYIAYAKELEPYMSIISTDEWSYSDKSDITSLDYAKVINVLERSWKAETDNELKLRYGYQLVRFAHYNRKYAAAVNYFNTYVESLHYKPAMYYHALSQKAGALRGQGDIDAANYDFFTVFCHSKNLKESALSSIRFNENVDFNAFLKRAKSQNEINDAYLLLGFYAFSNPIAAAEKITAKTPDAIQAKVLMTRAVNDIERNYNFTDVYCWNDNCLDGVSDKRYPFLKDNPRNGQELVDFFQQSLTFSQKMANLSTTQDKNFWNLTTAYLQFLQKDFTAAKSYLSRVNATDAKYQTQKSNLAMYIDICEPEKITAEIETALYNKYEKFWNPNTLEPMILPFITDVLANRYYLQKDYAKSFLLSHPLAYLEQNPNTELLSAIEKFYHKANKNPMEQHIAFSLSYLDSGKLGPANTQQYIDYLWGNIYLAQGNLEKSLQAFKQIKPDFTIMYFQEYGDIQLFTGKNDYDGYKNVPSSVFGYNRVVWFDGLESAVMQTDFLTDFPFIKSFMNKKELVETLIQLQKIGKKNDELGAKANYLAGNFFYNVSRTGYYRHLLRFDQNNSAHNSKFGEQHKPDIYNNIYFKYYPTYYANNLNTPNAYLQTAYTQAKNPELKARILFALAKCEQEADIDQAGWEYRWDTVNNSLKYFGELQKYSNTRFYSEVKSNCKYFESYVNGL